MSSKCFPPILQFLFLIFFRNWVLTYQLSLIFKSYWTIIWLQSFHIIIHVLFVIYVILFFPLLFDLIPPLIADLNAPTFLEFLINCPIYFFFTVIGGVFFFLRFTTSHSPWVFICTFEFFWIWLVDEFVELKGLCLLGWWVRKMMFLSFVLGFLGLCRWIWRWWSFLVSRFVLFRKRKWSSNDGRREN